MHFNNVKGMKHLGRDELDSEIRHDIIHKGCTRKTYFASIKYLFLREMTFRTLVRRCLDKYLVQTRKPIQRVRLSRNVCIYE